MKLYFNPKSRATRTFLLLEELAVDYDLVKVDFDKREHKTADFLSLNPLGQLPTLDDDGVIFAESVAISIYLADKYADKGLAPAIGSAERGPYLYWSAFTIGSLEMAIYGAMLKKKGGELPGAPELDDVLGAISSAVKGRNTLLPSGFSAADVLIGSSLAWLRIFGTELPETLAEYANALGQRPSFKKLAALQAG